MYYKEISNFINIPIKFTGLGARPDIYKTIPNKNSKLLDVYTKAEEVFGRLEKMVNTFIPWTALGYFDLETYIEENFKDVKDWDNNFKLLRVKRKQLEKLNESYKIDSFFNIRTEPFKKGIEDLFHRTQETLKQTLKTAIKTDMEAIDIFIDEGMKKLNARPQSVEEIGQAKAEAIEISGKKDKFVDLYNQCEERNKILQQVSGEGAHIGEMQNRWENFDVALNAFSSMIDEQKNVLKQETDKRIHSLNEELEKTFNRWEALKPKDRSDMDRETAMETSEKMKEWREKWDELETKIKNITADCEHFGIDKPQLTYYEELKNDLAKQEESWRFYDEFYKELSELGQEDWLSFSRGKGIYQFQDFMDKWAEKIKNREPDSVKRLLNQAIENFKEAWPLFKICVGEAFEKEHWRAMFYMLEFPKEVTVENLKFIHFLDAIEKMVEKAADIKDLGARAQGEVSIREAIQELRAWCDQTEFALTEYVGANNRTVPLIKDWKDLMNQVSDNQSLLMSLKESRFFSRFSDQVDQFESKLIGIDDYLQKLNIIQRKWVYLEPIFIRGALPSEQTRFNRVDGEYVSIMMGIGMRPRVIALCDVQGLKDTLDTILSQLEVCQKALNDYLEEKRSKFPRFYFIGDDDLLEILGQATNPVVIQTHLKKLFAGIFRVDFNSDNTAIVAMKSSAGEYVELSSPVRITEDVEIWLNDLVNEMKQSLSSLLRTTLNSSGMDIVNTPSQICCLSEMVHFSNNTIQAIKKGKLSNYKIDLQKNLENYTSFDHGGDQLLLSKLKALTLDIIHNIEVVDLLISTGVKNTSQWGWHKQLKYSIDPRNDVCNVGMCDAIFDYTFEYQGNAPKLVHTPLTDKCYLTLTQGMKMGYGGNPYGPAGTGKTESVKALGQAFGRQVLVFNCDEGIDFKSMGRIFIGLVKCGAWGCFDEFNRLLEEQLSAISQQIQVIQWAIKQGEPTLELLNRTIEVNKNAGIFVTMNPAGKGYGGRSKLPDNLKQLFRPVAMSAPDNELIAEVLLFAEGFKQSKQLAQKLIPLFTLSKQLLSTQQHYDWGLRALKTILTVGGQLIQRERAKKSELTFNEEALILIKAIRINTMSKLTFGDSKKFEFLLNDMFPGIKVEDIIYEDLEKAINEVLDELNLEKNPKQLSKMLQFHEATNQRMGVVIVGPSGCGKSTIWKVLKKAYEKLNKQMTTHVMNPKSMPRQQLLGVMDHDTREFKDGVLTEAARQVVKEPVETRCWIICDGDIDPEWIESLNSVLDDNHLLTLPNGERISFGDNVNFIFESDNLKFASPATVSRMGMIFLSEEDVDVSRLIHTWIKKREDESMRSKLESWMDEIFYKALEWVLMNEDKWIIETTKVGIVHNVLSSLHEVDTKA